MGAVKRMKNGEWERNRRDRLNVTFLELSQLLPDHDPTLTMPKIEILSKSINYIKELKEKYSNLFERNCTDSLKSEVVSMKQLISDLRMRNEQLADLLRKAKITIPKFSTSLLAEPFTPPRKWAGKFIESVEKTDNKKKKLSNISEKSKSKPVGQKSNHKVKVSSKIMKKIKGPVVKPSPNNKLNKVITKVITGDSPSCEINNSQMNPIKKTTLTCPVVPLVLSQARTNLVTVSQSSVQTAPIMATGIQPVLQRNPTLSALGPGTLIMPDGRLVPLPAPPPVQPAAATAVILMQGLGPLQPPINTTVKAHSRPIVPKPKQKDTTRTTFVNKVPIPAISSQRTLITPGTNNKPLQITDCKKVNNKKKTVQDNVTKHGNKEEANTQKKKLNKSATIAEPNSIIKKPEDQNNSAKELNSVKNDLNDDDNSELLPGDSKRLTESNGSNDHSQSIYLKKRKIIEVLKDTDNSKIQKVDIDVSQPNNINIANSKSFGNILNHKSDNKEKYSIDALCTIENIKDNSLRSTSTTTSEKDNSSNSTNVIEVQLQNKTNSSALVSVFEGISKNYDTIETCVANSPKAINTNIESSTIERVHLNNKSIISNTESQGKVQHENDHLVLGNTKATEIPIDQLTNAVNDVLPFNINHEPNCVVDQNTNTEKLKPANINNNLVIPKPQSTHVTADQKSCLENKKESSQNKTSQAFQQSSGNNELEKLNEPEKPNTNISEKGNNPGNKLVISDENAELSSLFPSDPKLQSCPENLFRDNTDFRERSLFMPISHSYMDEVRLSLPHSDFSNDLFSSLQVPTGSQHPESISPTAAFLLAFPLVSTSKTSELIAETENNDSQHATPTTILQIGNIDPPGSDLYHQTSLMIENNVTNLQDPLKLNKSIKGNKSNSNKQQKEVEQFNKFQQLEIPELIRNETLSRDNCKEKKCFTIVEDQEMFNSCNKKKPNTKPYEFSLSSEVAPQFQEKPHEFASRHNIMRNPTIMNEQSNLNNNSNQKKNQIHLDNTTNSHNSSISLSQPYPYNAFTNGSRSCQQNLNYHTATNRSITEMSKVSQSSNFNLVCWSTTSTTATSRIDYTTSYCAYPQKPHINATTKHVTQKVVNDNYEDHRLKDKPSLTNHSLPKFSANFQFNSNRNNIEIHEYLHSNQTDNLHYRPESKTKKLKSNSQRAPVNWMTTPDIRSDHNLAPVVPDLIFPPQKELDAPFNIPSTVSNNPQTLYPSAHFSAIDQQLDFAPFPEINSTNKPPKNVTSVSCSQQNHNYSWSPSKSTIPLLSHIDNHMIPSTLPTLVGDLALGTTTPSGPVDAFRNLSMPTTPFNIETPAKKCDSKLELQKPINSKLSEKNYYSYSEVRLENKNLPDYCQKTHSHQGTNTTSSFLSVSQLVDQVKSEQNSSRRGGKHSVVNKSNASMHKRNNSNHQTDKNNHSNKIVNIHSNTNSYHQINATNSAGVNERKIDSLSNYQENFNSNVGFPGVFGNQVGPPPCQNSKSQRGTSHYKGGSYSAESLIADHTVPTTQDQISEVPPFSIANQYTHASVVSSASYTSSEYPLQSVQSLEFHQSHQPHQNCFNFPTHNTPYSSAPFNPDSDFNMGLDPPYSFNQSASSSLRNNSCQTSSQGGIKDNRSKRSQTSKRREEFSPQFSQVPQNYSSARTKCHPLSTSSTTHPATTTLTNFNLSTIFPEINDKMVVQGSNAFHMKHSERSVARSNGRPDYPITNFNPNLIPQMQQMGSSAPFLPVSTANLSLPPANYRA